MANDLATAIADQSGAAVDIVLDGVGVRAFVNDLEFQGCPYDGVVLARKEIILLLEGITTPIPTQRMVLDDVSYTIESSCSLFPALIVILTRFAS